MLVWLLAETVLSISTSGVVAVSTTLGSVVVVAGAGSISSPSSTYSLVLLLDIIALADKSILVSTSFVMNSASTKFIERVCLLSEMGRMCWRDDTENFGFIVKSEVNVWV